MPGSAFSRASIGSVTVRSFVPTSIWSVFTETMTTGNVMSGNSASLRCKKANTPPTDRSPHRTIVAQG